MVHKKLNAVRVWASTQRAEFGPCLPNQSGHPNPLLVGDKVVMSCFTTNKIETYSAVDGRTLWSVPLTSFGGPFVTHWKGRVYSGNALGIACLDLPTGKLVWEYRPFGASGEHSYSGAVVHEGLVFLGDRKGYLHCVDALSGRLLWKKAAGRGLGQLNADPLPKGDRVYTVTNDGEFTVFSRNGERLLCLLLPHGSTHGLVESGGRMAALAGDKIYLISKTGRKITEIKSIGKPKRFVGLGTSIFTVEERLPPGQDSAEFFFVEYKKFGTGETRSVKMDYLPNAIISGVHREEACVVGWDKIDFIDLKRMELRSRIDAENEKPFTILSGVPHLANKKIFLAGFTSEVVCLDLSWVD